MPLLAHHRPISDDLDMTYPYTYIHIQLLISFRKVLGCQLSADEMSEVVKNMHLHLGDGDSKPSHADRAGAAELEVYVTVTQVFMKLRSLLLKCIVAG
jgi:hypothetical protein